jgi:hypothetical protein
MDENQILDMVEEPAIQESKIIQNSDNSLFNIETVTSAELADFISQDPEFLHQIENFENFLVIACSKQNWSVAQVLIENGAELNSVDEVR